MKNLLIILFSFFFLQKGFGQEQGDSILMDTKKMSIIVYYSSNLNYRKCHSEIVGIDGLRPQSSDILAYKSSEEIPSYGYQLGIISEFRAKEKVALGTGLSFGNVGYQTKQIDTVFGLLRDGGPYQYYTILNDLKIKYKFYYVSLPISVGYRIKLRSFILAPAIGGAIDYLVRYRRIITNISTNNSSPDAFGYDSNVPKGSINFSFNANINLEYANDNCLSIQVGPVFKYISMIGTKSYFSNISTPLMYFHDYSYYGSRTRSDLYYCGIRFGLKF